MDRKRLDLAAPLLSVRRITRVCRDVNDTLPLPPAKILLPYYKPELNSGPVRCPAAIPFMWESSPGLPKEFNSTTTEKETFIHRQPSYSCSAVVIPARKKQPARKQVTTESSVVRLPPLPKSPSESWLSRTLPSSRKRTSSTVTPFLVASSRVRWQASSCSTAAAAVAVNAGKERFSFGSSSEFIRTRSHMRFSEVLARPASP